MRTLVGLGNSLLLALNVSTLGTLAYKGRIWEPRLEPATTPQSMQQTLELTPSQARALEAERGSFMDERRRIEDELQKARENLFASVRDGRTDPSVLGPWIDEIARLQTELDAKAATQLVHERSLLTPGQRERYFSQMENRLQQGRRNRGGRLRDPSSGSMQQEDSSRGKKGRGKGWRR